MSGDKGEPVFKVLRPVDGSLVVELQVEDIDVSERIRFDLGEIDLLAESIGKIGLLNPITLLPIGHGRYKLLAGFRRLEAIKRLGRKTILGTVVKA